MASPKNKTTTKEPRCAAIARRLAAARKLVSRLEEQLAKVQAAEEARAKAKADKLRARHERELERTRKRQERERTKAGVAHRCTVRSSAPRARRRAGASKSTASAPNPGAAKPAYLILHASVNGPPTWSWRPMGAKRSKGTGFTSRDAAAASLKAAGYVLVDPPAGPPRPAPKARTSGAVPKAGGGELDELLRAKSTAEMEDFIQGIHAQARDLQRAGKDAEYERLMRQARPFLDHYEQLVMQQTSGRSRRRRQDTSTGPLFGN
ncbi:hypothetical protein SAMN02745121_08575 [Nannocystis exedens]|uniref:Uncharacterized protein n=1 Tax=Nannocystis exedens TaxID=54 RepID=A0A1I2IFT3_9BACT|nr:hypothetical protein [Nannocystis exedens]PCC73136.1 hypothetical protein NAEX_06224 [Nannocystis exedens]SFF39411.1 hypothetical protein SAMN02745121_08575 [Nannocystis exedens]